MYDDSCTFNYGFWYLNYEIMTRGSGLLFSCKKIYIDPPIDLEQVSSHPAQLFFLSSIVVEEFKID